MGSKLVNLEDLNSKITSSEPAVFSLFVLFRLYIFFSGDAGLGVNGIGYHFEILDSQAVPTKKELSVFHALAVTMFRLFCID